MNNNIIYDCVISLRVDFFQNKFDINTLEYNKIYIPIGHDYVCNGIND